MRSWFERRKRLFRRLLVLAAIAVMVGLLKGAATEAGQELYRAARVWW
ncbi:hypothetical protein [Streptomyces showdoensis]|nr:hypothetical protein [Streptomyces showdoensis]